MGLVIWRKILYLNMMSVILYLPLHTEEGNRIRLVGSSQCSGRVEIYLNYRWGTVCDDSWDWKDADVVCRELSCGCALSAPGGAHFGQGSDPILMDEVACSGKEMSLTLCQYLSVNDCTHRDDAGVVCSGQTSPTLSASPSTLSPGEQLILNCSVPSCARLQVKFYQDGFVIGRQTSAREIRLSNVDSPHNYTCQYYSTQSTITSSHSSPVNIIVVRLPQPSILLTSQDAGLFWASDGSEVTRGYNFSITCSIEPQYPGGIFYLNFSGSNMTHMKPAVNHSASFQFPAAEYEHQGNYSCVYQVTVSSRKFSSNSSELLTVSVSTSPIPLLVGGAVGGVLLLLLLLIGFCLMCRRRHRRPAVKTDHTACVMNTYNTVGGANDDEDDAEEDYMYPDSDDYENVSVRDYKGASNMNKHVYNPGEDEEEEENDDSDDYENGDYKGASNMNKHVYNPGEDEEDEENDDDDDSDDYENGDYKEEEENDGIYANTDMYPESSTKEHFNPGRRAVEGQSDEDEQDNIYANYDG